MRGNPYDKATMEGFFKTIKHEEVYLYECETLTDVQTRLPYFIEQVYYLKRFTRPLATGHLCGLKTWCRNRCKGGNLSNRPNLFCPVVGVQSNLDQYIGLLTLILIPHQNKI